MCPPTRMCVFVLLLLFVFDGVLPSYERDHSRERDRRVYSSTRDWDTDWRQWARQQGWQHSDPVPEYDHTKGLTTRQLSPTTKDTRTVWATHQRGSVVVPHAGSTVRVTPLKEVSLKLYKGRIRATVSDWPKRRDHHRNRLRHSGSSQEHWQYSQDQPATPHPKPCVRCPGDRAVLAIKGTTLALMETPPIIPCHSWSSVKKVKSEILDGPQPGTKMGEGSHKMVLRLYRHRRTLDTCVIRYNVIVRKCPELEMSPGLKADCPLGKAWGSHCNLTCEPGYLLEGDSSIECSDDLEWTGDQPQCILSTACLAPVSPDNSLLSCRTPQHQPVSLQGASLLPDGTVCHFRCQPGFVVPPEQAHLTRMRCIAGSWDSDQDPVCVESNDLEEEDDEEDLPPDISVDDALRLDGKDCPKGFCHNGGKCLTILSEPMCSCLPGYFGAQCENQEPSPETEDNTIS